MTFNRKILLFFFKNEWFKKQIGRNNKERKTIN